MMLQSRAGLPVHGPHRNRHSVLTHLAERGESPYVLQALARHSDIETTMRFYVHVNKLALAKQAAASRVSPSVACAGDRARAEV